MSFSRHAPADRALAPPEPGDDIANPRWTIPDLIDFDYYVEADEHQEHDPSGGRESLAKRDRALYLERIKARVEPSEHTPAHRRRALRLWLAERRRAEDPALRPLLPGASFARGQRLVTVLLGVLGLISGGALASALLQYDGVRPVNVSWFIFVLVILQVLLIVGTVTAWSLRRAKSMQQALRDVSLLAHLIRPLFARVARWVQRHRLGQAPPEVRDRAQARQGLLQAHFSLYGPASYLPMLIPVQAFGIGFNLGALVVTLLLEWFSDLAFGWGSALNVDPGTIFVLAKFIAWPWSWLFGEGVGYPTLAEIAGTRINLKDPLYLLDAEHLRAWRWFLVLAVFSYGLVPRLLLLGLSAFVQRHALERLPFTHQRTQALYTRLVTPELDTDLGHTGMGPQMPIPAPLLPITTVRAAPQAADPEPQPPSVPQQTHQPRQGVDSPPIPPDACVLLLHVDVADVLEQADHGRLRHLLRQCCGWRVVQSATYGGGSAMAEQAIALITDKTWDAPPARIVLVDDGSQPPITERLRFLRRVRAAAGDQAPIVVSLIGDPQEDDPLPPVAAFDFGDWQRKIEQLADPYLRLTQLVPMPKSAPGEDAKERANGT